MASVTVKAVNSEAPEGLLHFFQLDRSDDGFNLFHVSVVRLQSWLRYPALSGRQGNAGFGQAKVDYGGGQAAVGSDTMFPNIESLDFFLSANPKDDQSVQNLEGHEGDGDGKRCYGCGSQQLSLEQAGPAAIEQSALGGEDAHRNGAEGSADGVDGNRSYRIVNFGPVIKELHRGQ
jgi:hypothetical protein